MKTTLRFTFDVGPEKADAILIPAGCGPDVAEVSPGFDNYDENGNFLYSDEWVELTLEENDERVPKLMGLLASLGIEPDVTRMREYSEEDRQNARLLLMKPTKIFVHGTASELGTKYDLTHACPHCGTGAKQTWYLRVKRKELPKIQQHRAIMTFDLNILVDATMQKLLVDAGMTGISFAEVHARDDFGEWNAIDREQILIEHTMPPMRAEFPAADDYALCKVCRRGGRLTIPDHAYREEDLAGLKDFNRTWEWFDHYLYGGEARHATFAHPRIMVTPKVMHVFREAGVTTFDWWPVGIAPST
jgi:hypothetical protein